MIFQSKKFIQVNICIKKVSRQGVPQSSHTVPTKEDHNKLFLGLKRPYFIYNLF